MSLEKKMLEKYSTPIELDISEFSSLQILFFVS